MTFTRRHQNMGYSCPLCGQSVSLSLYRKITGIWEERRKALQKIGEQRAKLLKKVNDERKKFRRRAAEFRKQKARLIKQAVEKQTSRLESKIRALKHREEEVENRAREKIRIGTQRAHREADRLATARLNSFKKEIRASLRDQLKKERQLAAQQAEGKYEKLKGRLGSALERAKIKGTQVQKLRDEIKELQKQLKRETTPQIEGLLYEEELAKQLRRRFAEDKVQHKGKGGDVIHHVIRNGQQAGVLVYECKRVQRYLPAYVKQAAEAKEKRKADFAVLVTNAMKRKTHGFFTEKGVLVVHHAGVLHLAAILRGQIIRIAEMKLGQLQRNKAVKLTLEYLEGPEFANSMEGIMQQALTLYEDLKHEVKTHIAVWRKRVAGYEKIYEDASTVKSTTRALLSGEPEYKKLIKTQTLPQLLELPELEKSVASGGRTKKIEVRGEVADETQLSADSDRDTTSE